MIVLCRELQIQNFVVRRLQLYGTRVVKTRSVSDEKNMLEADARNYSQLVTHFANKVIIYHPARFAPPSRDQKKRNRIWNPPAMDVRFAFLGSRRTWETSDFCPPLSEKFCRSLLRHWTPKWTVQNCVCGGSQWHKTRTWGVTHRNVNFFGVTRDPVHKPLFCFTRNMGGGSTPEKNERKIKGNGHYSSVNDSRECATIFGKEN